MLPVAPEKTDFKHLYPYVPQSSKGGAEHFAGNETLILEKGPLNAIKGGPLISNEIQSTLNQAKVLELKPWMVDFQKTMPPLPIDVLSNACPDKAIITHLTWNVKPNFETKTLESTARYSFNNKVEGNDELVLDVKHLNIAKIRVNGEEAKYKIVESDIEKKPDGLHIIIPSKNGLGEVEIEYETTSKSTALYWVDAPYTEGKKQGYLYSLFCENEGASAIPGQHSPQIRITYEVNVKTSGDNIALSSVSNNPQTKNTSGEYTGLRMSRAVPFYLLSLHVGDFKHGKYDDRTGVYAEPGMLSEVYNAFKMLPEMLKKAENICGPYNWQTYNPIVLGWAFPYMGMEHPCLSTLGRICLSHLHVLGHELAHSWTGNDITNATWQQFFWNEGPVTYLEYQITKAIWGEEYANMQFIYTLNEMYGSIDKFKKEGREDLLKLCQQTNDIEFTRIPYAKGALFFFMLENALGKEAFDQFLKDYMKVFYQNTMSDARFLGFLKLWLSHEAKNQDFEGFVEKHKINEWLYGTEIPSNAPIFKSTFVDEFNDIAKVLKENKTINTARLQKWDVVTISHFLSSLVDTATTDDLKILDDIYKFTYSKEMAIREEWARVCAKAGYLTPDTKKMISDYIIERNSNHKTNQIGGILKATEEGRKTVQLILDQEEGRLFQLVKKTLLKYL